MANGRGVECAYSSAAAALLLPVLLLSDKKRIDNDRGEEVNLKSYDTAVLHGSVVRA
jgi:hypothetical protein